MKGMEWGEVEGYYGIFWCGGEDRTVGWGVELVLGTSRRGGIEEEWGWNRFCGEI